LSLATITSSILRERHLPATSGANGRDSYARR
jgi:hypothetical protein